MTTLEAYNTAIFGSHDFHAKSASSSRSPDTILNAHLYVADRMARSGNYYLQKAAAFVRSGYPARAAVEYVTGDSQKCASLYPLVEQIGIELLAQSVFNTYQKKIASKSDDADVSYLQNIGTGATLAGAGTGFLDSVKDYQYRNNIARAAHVEEMKKLEDLWKYVKGVNYQNSHLNQLDNVSQKMTKLTESFQKSRPRLATSITGNLLTRRSGKGAIAGAGATALLLALQSLFSKKPASDTVAKTTKPPIPQ